MRAVFGSGQNINESQYKNKFVDDGLKYALRVFAQKHADMMVPTRKFQNTSLDSGVTAEPDFVIMLAKLVLLCGEVKQLLAFKAREWGYDPRRQGDALLTTQRLAVNLRGLPQNTAKHPYASIDQAITQMVVTAAPAALVLWGCAPNHPRDGGAAGRAGEGPRAQDVRMRPGPLLHPCR